ncbi:MAG: hypothetical protein KA163_01055 [Bacteroidia bacterium]|nr:hypothetical protein [Bacteroidia bacterium]
MLKILVLFLISYLYLYRSFNSFKTPYVTGDGFEYILMTEAFYNHLSPKIEASDIKSFKEKFVKHHNWDVFYKKEFVDNLIVYFETSKRDFREGKGGFYVNRNKNFYSYHFFFYSLINLPSYAISQHYGPLRSFYFTNAILVILTTIVLLFFTPFHFYKQILAALCFCFGTCYWYLGWQHTEVFSASLVTIALVLFFNKKHYWSLFVMGLVCLQTQPLVLLVGFIGLATLIEKGFNKKNILIIAALSAIAFIPPLFYLINYNSTNLIKDAGFLDTKYITLNRVTGFYFDVNQGLILAIPLILLIYLPLLIIELKNIRQKKSAFDFSLLLPLCIIAISITISTMGNWNHGMAIVNRYVSWISCIVMIHVFYLADKLNILKSFSLFHYFFFTQAITILYHQKFNQYDWSQNQHTPLAKWILNHHPTWYSPDPYIFALRTQPYTNLVEDNSPFVFFDEEKKVKKVLANRNTLDRLVDFGYRKEDIAEMKKTVKFNYDWGYLDGFETSFNSDQIYKVIHERKVQAAYGKILSSKDWTAQIHEKAKKWNMTFEQVIRLDAEYIVELDEKAQNEIGK